jgi:hypothetical protein
MKKIARTQHYIGTLNIIHFVYCVTIYADASLLYLLEQRSFKKSVMQAF